MKEEYFKQNSPIINQSRKRSKETDYQNSIISLVNELQERHSKKPTESIPKTSAKRDCSSPYLEINEEYFWTNSHNSSTYQDNTRSFMKKLSKEIVDNKNYIKIQEDQLINQQKNVSEEESFDKTSLDNFAQESEKVEKEFFKKLKEASKEEQERTQQVLNILGAREKFDYMKKILGYYNQGEKDSQTESSENQTENKKPKTLSEIPEESPERETEDSNRCSLNLFNEQNLNMKKQIQFKNVMKLSEKI